MSLGFWANWLRVACLGVIVYSLGLVFFPKAMLPMFDGLFGSFSTRTLDGAAVGYIAVVYRILGAVIAGWMTLIFWVTKGLERGQFETWQAITTSIALWFVLDTGLSLWTGVWQHAVFNLIFLFLFVVPLIASYPKLPARVSSTRERL
jgi:hypothetical protein